MLTHSKMDNILPYARTPSLLRLPLEVRQIIYSYLLPDVAIHAKKIDQDHIRVDGKSGAGLLRVNHQIHNELYHDWYRSTTFELRVFKDMAKFLHKHGQPGTSMQMPSPLKDVESLHLRLLFWKGRTTYDKGVKDWEEETPEVLWIIGRLLSSGTCSLKYLRITLDLETHAGGITYVQNITRTQTECHLLGNVLGSLESIRGLSEVHIEVYKSYRSFPSFNCSEVYNNFIEASRKYLDELEKKMMMPRIGEDVSGQVSSTNTNSPA